MVVAPLDITCRANLALFNLLWVATEVSSEAPQHIPPTQHTCMHTYTHTTHTHKHTLIHTQNTHTHNTHTHTHTHTHTTIICTCPGGSRDVSDAVILDITCGANLALFNLLWVAPEVEEVSSEQASPHLPASPTLHHLQ